MYTLGYHFLLCFVIAENVPTYGLGIRHMQLTVMSIAAFTAYVLRTNLNIAIVAMVDDHDPNNTNNLAEVCTEH